MLARSRARVFCSAFTFVIACLTAGPASAQQYTHISIGQAGAQPDGYSTSPSISHDNRFVAFLSSATNLVANDTNAQPDVFVRDRQNNTTTRVSVATGGGQSPEASNQPQISANGRFVVFLTSAALVPEDTPISCGDITPCTDDVYLHDRDTATTTRVSVATGNLQANGISHSPSISGDGRYIVFMSAATNLAPDDTNGVEDAFLHDRLSGTTTRISLNAAGGQVAGGATSARITTDGQIIAYTVMVPASDRPDPEACLGFATCGVTFVLHRESGVRTLLSPSWPAPVPGMVPGAPGERLGPISGDGRIIVVQQSVPATYTKYQHNRFITFDRVTGRATAMAWGLAVPGFAQTSIEAISDNGRVVAVGESTGTSRLRLSDRINSVQEPLEFGAFSAALGADARTVAFPSISNLDGAATTTQERIWVLDRDNDDDLMIDAWETQFGFDINSTGDAALDADSDNVSNLQEYERGTHPKAAATRYFAEGAANAFFSTRLATLNPNATAATVVYRFLASNGDTSSVIRTLPPESRTTLDLLANGLAPANDFSTVIESSQPLVVDRTMTWDSTGNGSHAETSLAAPSTTWYLAEGATHGSFDLFYLIQNPGDVAANVEITYMRLAPNAPVVKSYQVEPHSRRTIPVDGEGAELVETDVAASITSSEPIIVERAMYASAPGEPFRAGHGGAGVTAPALHWYLAEGATGSFFDTYVLVANPAATAAEIRVTYLLPNGVTFNTNHTVGPRNRLTLTVADQDPRLADTPVSVIVDSTNAQPVVVERTMWWPKGQWYEAHAVAGATQTGTRWALADGQAGSDPGTTDRPVDTYILIANTSATDGSATVKLFLEDGGTIERVVPLRANSRENFPTTGLFGPDERKRFGAIIESNGVPIVVERAMYTSANGITWTAGTAALATRLQ
jgi:hypothetical protein